MLWLLEHVNQIFFSELAPYLPLLCAKRRERVGSIRREQDRVQSVLAELLLRHALAQEYGFTEIPAIAEGETGKPFFPGRSDLHFNLSHCGTAVACALDAAPVGVDVQEYRKLRRAAAPLAATDRLQPVDPVCEDRHRLSTPPAYRILSGTERAWVEAGDTPEEQDRRFTAVWTCKEAFGKATGKGIHYEMKDTEFLPGKKPWRQYGYCFQQFWRPDAVLTLCASAPLPCIVVNRKDISELR